MATLLGNRRVATEHHAPNSASEPRAKRITAGIMLILTLWGVYLGRGAYLKQQDSIKGWLILLFVLAFLAFWGVMLASQKRDTEFSSYSKASISGAIAGLLAVVLAIPIELSLGGVQIDLSKPGIPAVTSLALLGISFLLSVIGLSRPQRQIGKNLGLLAFPFAVLWFCLRFAAGS